MKFSGKMCLKVILKVTKNQGLTLSIEDTFFEKPRGEGGRGGGGPLPPPPPPPLLAILGLRFQASMSAFNSTSSSRLTIGQCMLYISCAYLLSSFSY